MTLLELLAGITITAGCTGVMLNMATEVEEQLIPAYEQHYKQFEKFKAIKDTTQ